MLILPALAMPLRAYPAPIPAPQLLEVAVILPPFMAISPAIADEALLLLYPAPIPAPAFLEVAVILPPFIVILPAVTVLLLAYPAPIPAP
jgi:hypothetical protein